MRYERDRVRHSLRQAQGRLFEGRMEPSRGHSHREGGFQIRPYARAACHASDQARADHEEGRARPGAVRVVSARVMWSPRSLGVSTRDACTRESSTYVPCLSMTIVIRNCSDLLMSSPLAGCGKTLPDLLQTPSYTGRRKIISEGHPQTPGKGALPLWTPPFRTSRSLNSFRHPVAVQSWGTPISNLPSVRRGKR